MRIGTRAFYDSVSATVNRMQRELGDLTVAMSSGKKINRPSDNPLASTIIARAHIELAAAESRHRILDGGVDMCRAADAFLRDISSALRSAIETSTQGLQPGATDAMRQASAAAIRSSREAILTEGNAKVGNRYLFGGYQDRGFPLVEAAGVVSYEGDSGQLTVPVAAGRTCDISVPGDKVFNFVNDDGVRAVPEVDADVFTLLDELATAVQDGDDEAARELMDQADKLWGHVVQLRGNMGASEIRIDTSRNALGDAELRCHQVLADEESIDVAEAITEYVALETAYQAALSVLSRITSMPTMFDLMR